jgi:hypothetical protein
VIATYWFGACVGGGPQSFGFDKVMELLTACFLSLATLAVKLGNVATVLPVAFSAFASY